jgi:GTP-binding protein
MDSRHPLTELDAQMIGWFGQTGKPIHVLLSKADKLTRNAQARVAREVKTALSGLGERCSVQLFSSLEPAGVEEAEKVIGAWLGMSVEKEKEWAARPVPPGKPARPRKRNAMGWSARASGKAKPPR